MTDIIKSMFLGIKEAEIIRDMGIMKGVEVGACYVRYLPSKGDPYWDFALMRDVRPNGHTHNRYNLSDGRNIDIAKSEISAYTAQQLFKKIYNIKGWYVERTEYKWVLKHTDENGEDWDVLELLDGEYDQNDLVNIFFKMLVYLADNDLLGEKL